MITLLKQIHVFVKKPSHFIGFDWFVGIIFLICGANIDRCKTILSIVSELPAGLYIWPALRIHEQKSVWSKFEMNIQILLYELKMDNIIQMSQLSVNGLVNYLLNNCFLNVLEWNEICHFIIFALINPPEYLLFYLILMLQHIKDELVKSCVSNDIGIFEKVS